MYEITINCGNVIYFQTDDKWFLVYNNNNAI